MHESEFLNYFFAQEKAFFPLIWPQRTKSKKTLADKLFKWKKSGK